MRLYGENYVRMVDDGDEDDAEKRVSKKLCLIFISLSAFDSFYYIFFPIFSFSFDGYPKHEKKKQ